LAISVGTALVACAFPWVFFWALFIDFLCTSYWLPVLAPPLLNRGTV
jgi:hypothetical protein